MKILCNYTHCGPAFVRTGWGRVFGGIGHSFTFWQPEIKPAFDMFSEYEPDLFIGTTFDLDRATEKCIRARPNMRVILYASAWGNLIDEIDTKQYPLIVASQQEKDRLEKLKRETGRPDFVFLHYHPKWLERTLGGWNSIGIKPVSMLNAADTYDYLPGQPKPEFASDLAFVGGYWQYKSRNIDRFLLPLCYNNVPDMPLKIKIFGNQPWPVPQYLGLADNNDVKSIFASAKICPNLSEPHSTEFGFDVVERPYKVLSAGCFCISDYVQSSAEDIFYDCVPHAKTPQEFWDLIRYYLDPKNEEEKQQMIDIGQNRVLERHTYFDRIYDVFKYLGMEEECQKVDKLKVKLVNHHAHSIEEESNV